MPLGNVCDIYLAHMHMKVYVLKHVHTQYHMSTASSLVSVRMHRDHTSSLPKLFPFKLFITKLFVSDPDCAVEDFKYWIDFTSNNTAVRTKLHKLTIGQCMTHTWDVSAKLSQQRRILLHMSLSLPVCLCSMKNSLRAIHWTHLPLRVSLLGFLTLCWWETGGRGSEAHWPGTQETPEFRTSSNCGSGVKEVLTFIDLFTRIHPYYHRRGRSSSLREILGSSFKIRL